MSNISKTVRCLVVSMFLVVAAGATAQYPTGKQVMDQEMAKARAEKVRNDAIVEKQRAAERAKKPTPKPPKPTSPSSSDETKSKPTSSGKSK